MNIPTTNTKFQDLALAPMHTVEHLLNGIVSRKLKCPRAFTTHIEKKKSKIDLKCSRTLTSEEIKEIEDEINQILSEDISITEEFISRTDAMGHYDLGRLPEHAGDTIRIVRIGNYDACPCIGCHVENLKEIKGKFKIISSDYNKDNEILRIRFKILSE